MKMDLREIYGAPNRAAAETAICVVRREIRRRSTHKAVDCLTKDRDALLSLLRFPRRALGPPAHLEPDRERVRHRAASDGAYERRAVADDGQADGLQADDGCRQDMAKTERRKSVAEGRRGVTFRDGIEVIDRDPKHAA